MIQGCRQAAQGPAAPPAPRDLWHQQQEPTSELQGRPFWTSPLLHHSFPKSENTDTEPTALPFGIPTNAPYAQPWERLFSGCHFCSAPHPFPLLTQPKGATPPALPVLESQSQRRNEAWWETAATRPSERRGPDLGMVQEPLWGARSRNCGVGGWVEGVTRAWLWLRLQRWGRGAAPNARSAAPNAGSAAPNAGSAAPGAEDAAPGACGRSRAGARTGSPHRTQPGPARAPRAIPPCPPGVLTRRGRCRCCRTPCGCRPGSSPPPRCGAGRWAA